MRLFDSLSVAAGLIVSNLVLEASAGVIKPVVRYLPDGRPRLELEAPPIEPPEPLHPSMYKRDAKEDYSLVVDETFYWTFQGKGATRWDILDLLTEKQVQRRQQRRSMQA